MKNMKGRGWPCTDSPAHQLIKHLTHTDRDDSEAHLLAIGYELEALVSIYSSDAIKLAAVTSRPASIIESRDEHEDASFNLVNGLNTASSRHSQSHPSEAWTDAVLHENLGISPIDRIRYELSIPLWEPNDTLEGVKSEDMPTSAPLMRILVSLGPSYPTRGPPQLQLLGRYLGSFPIDSGLFGDITRTYISSSGVPFTPGDVCVFEGLTHVQILCRKWYAAHLAASAKREEERQSKPIPTTREEEEEEDVDDGNHLSRPSPSRPTFSYTATHPNGSTEAQGEPSAGLKIHHSEPIVDRKSTFVGHAVRITDEREVPLIIHELLSDKKIARAAHPAIFAYRVVRDVGGAAGKVTTTDHDDDGETQAGSRLKHLLEILELDNVLVVVTRWYGGTLLGADRFKHINQAARDALQVGGFLDEVSKDKDKDKKKRK
ncbi:ribosomal protein S5 domain 2-type protein [Kockovaella imperatae]|uniref:Ribosomal protein S5 domain 2-type protein n=1 Tax=Kockovaella imperatae TaxID=4999 RepID=A0A1Y1U8L0_9TREE|nr:ribosomal protein S5 domain 2-type protein [Kockovaella imperatae]ORX34381.1 ribosomal protein S5 domain 2-type protein [Kockovaella imperatae]